MCMQDPFGNYVVQYVLELGHPEATERIMEKLGGHYSDLAQQKFSSNVVEKCLKLGGPSLAEARERVIRELIASPVMARLLQASLQPLSAATVHTLPEWCHRGSCKSLDQQDRTVSSQDNPQGVYCSLELSDEVVLVQQWHMSLLMMRQRSVAAGPIRELCASERAERVQRAAACCAGGCHARLPAILARHPTREADFVQDQRQDLGLRHRLEPYVNVQL